MGETAQLVEVAVRGRQVELWLESPIGKYVVARSEEIITESTRKLKRVAPWRRRRIMELQNEIENAERFQVWMADMIAEGIQATEVLEEEHGT